MTWDNVTTATWVQDSYAKLASKRIAGVFNLGVVALQYEAAQSYPGKFKFLILPVPPTDLFTVFSKTERGASFVEKYNEILEKNQNAFDALIRKYAN